MRPLIDWVFQILRKGLYNKNNRKFTVFVGASSLRENCHRAVGSGKPTGIPVSNMTMITWKFCDTVLACNDNPKMIRSGKSRNLRICALQLEFSWEMIGLCKTVWKIDELEFQEFKLCYVCRERGEMMSEVKLGYSNISIYTFFYESDTDFWTYCLLIMGLQIFSGYS